MDSSFPDVHSVPQACEHCDSSIQLLRSSAMPVLVDGRVLRLDGCATAAARGAVAGSMARVSRDARTEGARRIRAHERAQKPQDSSGGWVEIEGEGRYGAVRCGAAAGGGCVVGM